MLEQSKPSYYAVIPANVRYDNRLSYLARIIYGEISCLCNKDGYCYASNSYFANLYECTTRTVQNALKDLKDYNYIQVKVIDKVKHQIFIVGYENNFIGGTKNISYTHEKNFSKNNTREYYKDNTIKAPTLLLKNNTEYIPSEEDIARYKAKFPKVNVEVELEKMSGWLAENKRRRPIDVNRFILNWLGRAKVSSKVDWSDIK